MPDLHSRAMRCPVELPIVRTLHDIAGGVFFTIGDALKAESLQPTS